MQFKFKNIKFSISFSFFSLILLLIIFNRTDYLYISLISAILHEAGHLIMLKKFRVEILEISISLFGGNIKRKNFEKINYLKEIFIALAGPLINIIISLSFYFINLIFKKPLLNNIVIVNLVLAIFNLLPFYNFDGGKALEFLVTNFSDGTVAKKVTFIISIVILIPFTYFSFMIYIYNQNNFYYLIVTSLMVLTIVLKK